MSRHCPIGLIMATYIEAKPFVKKMDWQNFAESPFPVYSGKDLTLVISGMGKANAASACAWLCTATSPGCIVNIGAAGANRDDLPVGGIHHINAALDTDRRHFKTNEPFCHRPDVMPGFSPLRLATGEKPVMDPNERRQTSLIADLSDMEGAALVQTAVRFGAPCFLFKFVSDTPEHTTGGEIAANIRYWRNSVFDFFMAGALQKP